MKTASTLPPISHHVFFWLNNPESITDKHALIDGIKTLATIEGVQAVHIGEPASTESRDVIDNSYSVTELLFFDSIDAEQHYQSHPIHQEFIANCAHLWRKVVVFDSVEVSGS